MNRDYEILKNDLTALGLKKGDSVLIHSSYKSMGGLEGGIQTFVEAMLSVLGESGTLIAPTLTYAYVPIENPVFDYANTPSCVGAISEYIRCMDGSVRSIHPTHSCTALGNKAEFYTNTHYLDCTPVGKNSPFFKLKENGGKVLMLGCGTKSNTSMHGVEEYFGTSYVLSPIKYTHTIILPDKTYTADHHRHNIRQSGFAQRYDRAAELLDGEYISIGDIHGAKSYLMDASELWKRGLKALEKDELYFVDRVEE